MANIRNHLAASTAYAEAIAILTTSGGTVQEISVHAGLQYATTRKLIYALHRRGVIRVALWRKDAIGRRRLPVYAFGTAPDAAQPPGMTLAERVERYEAKRREIAQRFGVPMRGVRLRDYPEEKSYAAR